MIQRLKNYLIENRKTVEETFCLTTLWCRLTVCGLWEDSNSKQLHNIKFV